MARVSSAKILENKETEIEEVKKVDNAKKETKEVKKTTRKNKSKIGKELRKQAKDIDIEIESLIDGTVFYEARSGEILELNEIGQRDVVSLDLLLDMNKKSIRILNELMISIVDIYNDEFEVVDVLELLNLKNIKGYEKITSENIDKFILSESIDKFEKEYNKITDENLKKRIIERAVSLDNEGLLKNLGSKKSILEEDAGNEYLFRNI